MAILFWGLELGAGSIWMIVYAFARCRGRYGTLSFVQDEAAMLTGLYKLELHSSRNFGRGVVVARAGRIFGGNGAVAFAGRCHETDDGVAIEISTLRRNKGPSFDSIGLDRDICLQGRRDGNRLLVRGTSPLLGGAIKAVLTKISEDAAPPARASGPEGIHDGLYSLHIRMLDGIDAGNSGIMVLHDGTIRGGDSLFDYVGAYWSGNGRWKGELINREHTPSHGERPVFGGREVGIGFSGTYDGEGAECEATALAGKRSIRFRAVLRRLAAA